MSFKFLLHSISSTVFDKTFLLLFDQGFPSVAAPDPPAALVAKLLRAVKAWRVKTICTSLYSDSLWASFAPWRRQPFDEAQGRSGSLHRVNLFKQPMETVGEAAAPPEIQANTAISNREGRRPRRPQVFATGY